MMNQKLVMEARSCAGVQRRALDGTVWLSPREMGIPFDVSTDNICLHLKTIYADGELSEWATAEESSVGQKVSDCCANRPLKLYNLDAIIAGIRGKEGPTTKETWRMIQPIIQELMTAKTYLHEICIPTWSS